MKNDVNEYSMVTTAGWEAAKGTESDSGLCVWLITSTSFYDRYSLRARAEAR